MSKFKSGDKARIKKPKLVADYEWFESNDEPDMDDLIGKTITLTNTHDFGKWYCEENTFWWREEWLVPVNRPKLTFKRFLEAKHEKV